MCIISGHSLTVQFECIARMFFFSLHHALIRELFRNFHTHAQRRSGGQSLGEGFFFGSGLKNIIGSYSLKISTIIIFAKKLPALDFRNGTYIFF